MLTLRVGRRRPSAVAIRPFPSSACTGSASLRPPWTTPADMVGDQSAQRSGIGEKSDEFLTCIPPFS